MNSYINIHTYCSFVLRKIILLTRMHSSSVPCTVLSSSHVYPSMHWAGGEVCVPKCTGQGDVYPSMHWAGCVCPGVCVPRGVCVSGVVCAQGVSDQGGCVYPNMH